MLFLRYLVIQVVDKLNFDLMMAPMKNHQRIYNSWVPVPNDQDISLKTVNINLLVVKEEKSSKGR